MNDSDKRAFAELMTVTAEVYGKEISKPKMAIWFADLQLYGIDEVRAAFSAYRRSPDYGRFMPTPADIIREIEGPTPTADQVIGAAMRPTTPLAFLFRQIIGSWNLANWNNHQLRPLAEVCISRMSELKSKVRSGDYLPHESEAMAKLGIDAGTLKLTDGSKDG